MGDPQGQRHRPRPAADRVDLVAILALPGRRGPGRRRHPDRALQRGDARMNAIAERWIGGCRRELLDRTLVWNQAHLRRILREYETPPQSAPAPPLPARSRAAETATP